MAFEDIGGGNTTAPPPAPGAPPGTPPAPGTYNGVIPGWTGIASANLAATTAFGNALARINKSRGSLLQQYGYTGTIDPLTGEIKNMGIDPNNPLGLYQQELRGEGQAQRSLADAAAARGFSGPGLGAAGATNEHFQHELRSNQLGQALTSGIADLQQQQDDAAAARDQTIFNNTQSAIQAAIAAGDFNPADPGATPPGAPPAGGGGDAPPVQTAGGTPVPPGTSPLNRAAIALRNSNQPRHSSPRMDPAIRAAILNSKARAAAKKKGR